MKRNRLLISGALALIALVLVSSKTVPSRVDAASPLPAPPQTVPFFELYNNSSGYHRYTANKETKAKLTSNGEYQLIKIAGNIFPTQVPGTVKLHTLVDVITVKWANGSVRDSVRFLYTTSDAEFTNLQKYGWHDFGAVGYIAPNQLPGTVPLYRLLGPEDFDPDPNDSVYYAPAGSHDNYYTTDFDEMNSLVQMGWTFIHIEGYVWEGPTTLGAPAPPAPPESFYLDPLYQLGCSKVAGPNVKLICQSPPGFFNCLSDQQQGKINVTACIPNFDLAGFNKMEADLIDQGCQRATGGAGQYICESWNGGELCESFIKTSKGLITRCFTPRQNLMSSYLDSFGRAPTEKEIAYWSTQMKTKKIDYKGLMAAHHQWLKTAAASAERKAVANRSIYEAFGRYGNTVEEVDYIAGLIAQDGRNYADLVKGHVAWMTGGSPQQEQELHEMVKRAFMKFARLKNYKNLSPDESQIQDWMAKAKAQKLTFNNLVLALLSASKFPAAG